MNNNIYGIDLGTCNFKVFCKASGKIFSEKNTIAVINKNQIYAYGDDAYAMYEKAPETIHDAGLSGDKAEVQNKKCRIFGGGSDRHYRCGKEGFL